LIKGLKVFNGAEEAPLMFVAYAKAFLRFFVIFDSYYLEEGKN